MAVVAAGRVGYGGILVGACQLDCLANTIPVGDTAKRDCKRYHYAAHACVHGIDGTADPRCRSGCIGSSDGAR